MILKSTCSVAALGVLCLGLACIVAVSSEDQCSKLKQLKFDHTEPLNETQDDGGMTYFRGSRLHFSFSFTSEYRPHVSFMLKEFEKYEYTDTRHFILQKGLSFAYEFVHLSGNDYETQIIIDPFDEEYAGYYRIFVQDTSDENCTLTKDFNIDMKRRKTRVEDTEFRGPPCFSPQVYNITATGSSSSAVSIQWHLTTREDQSIDFCDGSRQWQVKLLKFPTLSKTPADYEVVDSSTEEWKTVHEQDTHYTFINESLSKSMYYSFQVRQNDDRYADSVVTASQVYYFGQQAPATIQKRSDSIIRLYVGSSRTVNCIVNGKPTPNVRWIRQAGRPPSTRKNKLKLKDVTKDDAGVYICVAFNVLVNPPKGKRDESDTWKITVIVEDYDISQTGLSCQTTSLESSVCKNFIYNGFEIFTNHNKNESAIEREQRATSLFLEVNHYIPLGTCRDLAHSMLCHNVYPYCDVSPGKPTPRKLCKSVCQEFLNGRCEGHLPKDSSIYNMLIEGCDNTREYSGGEPPECIPLSYKTFRTDQVEPIEDTGDCVKGNGRGYSGNIYRTESGAVCQSWGSQTPHQHPMLPEIYRSDLGQAHFSCRNPGGVGSRPWCYTNDPALRWEYCSIPKCDSCELYHGDICKNIEGYEKMNVTVTRSKQLQSQHAIEEKISLFFRSLLFLQPTEGCKDIIRVLLCHGAFPQCTETSSKQLCFDHCQFNSTLKNLCPSVYNEFAKFMIANEYWMSSSDCTTMNSEDHDKCISMPAMSSAENPTKDNIRDDCYEGNGNTYNGTVSETKAGIPCQSWDSRVPHSHPITSLSYPELRDSKNYCRNPGNLKKKPWCYTTDSETVWDYCEIEHCDHLFIEDAEKSEVGNENESELVKEEKGSTSGPIVATMSVLIVILVALMGVAFTGCYFFLSRKNRRAKAILESEFRLSKMTREAFEGEKYVTNTDYTKVPATARSQSLVIPENFTLLDSKNIKYVSQLGQGNFGIVFKGKAFGIKQDNEEDEEGIDVAVKTLKEEATSEVKQDFIDEAKLMFTFDHPNILKIHGVCMSEMPYQLVFEYMDEGDLTKFLRSRASSQQRRLINPFSYRSRTESSYSDDPASLTKTELLYICKQIASGMKYLAENKHVHRDLACRNCLIKSDLVVKIGDFGMSRNLYSKDYYRINGNAVLPVRWMSPESLIYGKFSIEGDVWSFGVVMWEVFSFALQPYYGITNEEVTEAIRKGKTLNRPDDCPVEVYRLMKECWTMDPADRITFPELYESLSALHQLASLCGSSIGEKFTDDEDDAFSDSSDMPSDAFYSEEHLDNISKELEENV